SISMDTAGISDFDSSVRYGSDGRCSDLGKVTLRTGRSGRRKEKVTEAARLHLVFEGGVIAILDRLHSCLSRADAIFSLVVNKMEVFDWRVQALSGSPIDSLFGFCEA